MEALAHGSAGFRQESLLRATIRRLATTALLTLCTTAAAERELPAIGDPADQVFSPRQEAAIGRQMMARARAVLELNGDPQIAAYLDRVGQRLAARVGNAPADGFEFFVVHAPGINAFAAPGGYIGINSGLILQAENEAQLAAVLAHEIAHVTQRHIARAYAASQRSSYGTLAAVLAGIILSSQDSQAGQAAITTGIAAEQQRRINYTRSNEYEADRIGIRLLTEAGYHPDGMAGMFDLLAQAAGGTSTPEFLRTHPLSSSRIAEARARAARIDTGGKRRDSLAFHQIRTRLAVLEADEPQVLYQRWQAEGPPEATHAAAAHAYGLALLETELGEASAAVERLRSLRSNAPDDLHYGLALIDAYRAADRGDDALALWQEMSTLHPSAYPVIAAGTALHVELGRAPEAVELATEFVRRADDPPAEAWRDLARAAQAAERPLRSHEALAEFHARTDRYDRALKQLELALDAADETSSAALRLEARMEQVRELQRRRMRATPASGG